MQITIPPDVVTWLCESEDPKRTDLGRELRIQLSSDGTEHHPARITAVVSLWEDMADLAAGRLRPVCVVDAEGRDLPSALESLDDGLSESRL